MKVTVIARCVFCKHEVDVSDQRDTPLCPRCFSPMFAVKATALGGATAPVVERETGSSGTGGARRGGGETNV